MHDMKNGTPGRWGLALGFGIIVLIIGMMTDTTAVLAIGVLIILATIGAAVFAQ